MRGPLAPAHSSAVPFVCSGTATRAPRALERPPSRLVNVFIEVLSEELLELVDRKSGGRQPGFTKACRMVLMEAARPLGAREVCEHIQQRIPPVLLRHKDPLASVTTVLNRLVEYGEARTVVRENGRRAWQWVADPADSGFAPARGSLPISNL